METTDKDMASEWECVTLIGGPSDFLQIEHNSPNSKWIHLVEAVAGAVLVHIYQRRLPNNIGDPKFDFVETVVDVEGGHDEYLDLPSVMDTPKF